MDSIPNVFKQGKNILTFDFEIWIDKEHSVINILMMDIFRGTCQHKSQEVLNLLLSGELNEAARIWR
jgi:hypothetical protein